jgi:hypothetical protein
MNDMSPRAIEERLRRENDALRADNEILRSQVIADERIQRKLESAVEELRILTVDLENENAALRAERDAHLVLNTRLNNERTTLQLELTQRRAEAATRGLRVEVLENLLARVLRSYDPDAEDEAKKLLGWE